MKQNLKKLLTKHLIMINVLLLPSLINFMLKTLDATLRQANLIPKNVINAKVAEIEIKILGIASFF